MADKKFNIIFDVDANIGPVKNAVSNLQSALSKINVPDSFKKGLTDTFTRLDNEIKNFESIASKGFTNLADVNKAEKSFDRVTDLLSKLRTEAARLKGVDPNKLLPKETIDKTKALHSEWVKLKAIMDKGFGNTAEIAKQNQELDKQNNKLAELQGKYNDLAAANKTMGARRGTLSQSLDADTKKTEELVAKMQELEKVKGGNRTAEYKQLSSQLEVLNGSIKRSQTEYDNLGKKINENKAAMAGYSTQITSTGNTISQIATTIEQLKFAAQQTPEGLNQLREKLAEIKGVNLDEIPTDIDAIGREIQDLNTDQVRQLTQSIDGLEPPLKEATSATQDLGDAMSTASGQMHEMAEGEKEIEQLANRVKTFFSIGNTVQLFKRAVKSAIDTVKELDEVMTQAAVVTKFDVSGMWAQLPEYTKRANELGVTIKGVYEASTLYYQQGLETEQVIGVTNETLKMAKIAGLDYATATDYMTSALRGFNMEVNELSAQKVNDIYSQLAAKTASNVEEISIAMSKVAPLAHNAGMEIETTAAMLAQMIEKTREAPETLGTAMKTVIARFQELKKDPALIEPIDGEMVDANKVETALNTIGVALRDTSGQFRQLDDVFLEISQKWDTLDVNTQRYIATIAAGSRQQSRFIAMMADYARTTDLVNLANNSAGASAEQFEKTQASLATALNRLKNAWDQFTMGLANNQIIKVVIDLIANFIETINKLTNTLSLGSGFLKSFFNLTALLGGIKLARAAFNGFFGWLIKTSKGTKKVIKDSLGNIISTQEIVKIKKTYKGFFGELNTGFSIVKKNNNILQQVTTTTTSWNVATKNLIKERLNLNKAIANNADSQLINSIRLKIQELEKERNLLQESGQVYITHYKFLTAAEGDALRLAIEKNVVDAEAIALLSTKDAVTLASALATGDEAKATYLAAKAQALKNIQDQGGIKGLLFAIGATVLKNAGLQVENKLTLVNIKLLWEKFKAQMAVNGVMAFGLVIILAIVAAIALLVAAIIAVIKAVKKTTLSERMKAAAEETKKAKEAADKAKEAYDQLLTNRSEYDDLQNKLEELTYGTQEWRQALIEANQEVLKLIQTYPQLAQYIGRGSFGQLTIDDAGWNQLNKTLQKQIAATAAVVMFSQNKERTLEQEKLEKEYKKESKQKKVRLDIDNLLNDQSILSTEEFQNRLEEIQQTYNLSDKKMKEATEAAIKYKNSLDSLNLQISESGKAFLAANLDPDTFKNLSPDVGDNLSEAFSNYITSSNFLTKVGMSTAQLTGYLGNSQKTKDVLDKIGKEYNVSSYMKEGLSDSALDNNLKVAYAAIQGLDVTDLKSIKTSKFDMAKVVAEAAESSAVLDIINEVGQNWGAFSKENQQNILLATGGANFYNGQEKIIDSEALKLSEIEEEQINAIFGSIDAFITAYNLAIDDGFKEIEKSKTKLTNLQIQLPDNFGANLDAGAVNGLTNHLLEIFEASGSEAATTMASDISNITASMDTDTAAKFATILHSLDWKNADNIEQLSDRIKEMGLDIGLTDTQIDGLEQQIISLAKAARTVDLEKLEKQIRGLGQIAYDIGNGKQGRNFSEEIKNTLVEEGIAKESDFVFNFETGEFTYLGSSMDSLKAAIIENTKALTGKTKEQLDKDIASAETAEGILKRLGQVDSQKANDTYNSLVARGMNGSTATLMLDEMIKNGDFTITEKDVARAFIESGKSDKSLDWLDAESTTETMITEFVNSMRQQANSLPGLIDEKTALEQDEAVQDYMTRYQGKANVLADMANSGDSVASDTLKLMAINAGVAEEAINSLNSAELASVTQTYQEAESWGVDSEQLAAYAQHLQDTILEYKNNAAAAYEVALANLNVKMGLEALSDGYEEWSALLNQGVEDEAIRNTVEYAEALKETRKAVKQMTNSNNELSNSFFTQKENLDLIEKAISGDEDSIKKLQSAMALDSAKNGNKKIIKPEVELPTEDELSQAINNVINDTELDAIDVSMTMDNSKALDTLYNTLLASGATAEQIQDAFNDIGWNPDVETEEYTLTEADIQKGSISIPGADGETVDYPIDATSIVGSTIQIPHIGKGSNHISASKTQFDADAFSSIVDKGNGSKGGGGGSEPEWENPYDRLYNYLKEINGQLRIREQLEKRYNRLIKLNVETGQSLKENIDNQIASLEEQNRLQKIVSDERLKDIKKIQAENFDLNKYARFDETIGVGGEVQIEWDLINDVDKANDEELGKRIEDYISKMEEWADSRHEAIDAIEDNTDAIIELQQTGKEEYKDLEDRALDAIINHQQNLIDEQEKINDSINEANEALTDAISKNIEKIRQDRQNQETETSLAEKERRLAYLRQDTTGSNAVEIKKLEKDLEKERQNYTDSLIDQSLNDLKEQNDAAAKQREKQIELMQSQLDEAVRTGAFADQATDLVKKVMTGGFVDVNSDLYNLLVENEDYYKMTNASRKDWFEQLQATIAEAFVYSQTVDSSNIMESMISAAQSGNLGIFEHLESQRNAKIRSQGLQDEWPETNMYNDYRRGRTAEHTDKDTDYMQKLINSANSGNWSDAFMYAGLRDRKIEEYGITGYASEESFWKAFKMWYDAGQKQYLNGGLADFTGPAWLDGTKSRPEMVLNARDTQNFLELRDILSSMAASGTGNSSVGNFYCDIDINVGEISNDYDVDRIAARIKQSIYEDSTYRNVNAINFLK